MCIGQHIICKGPKFCWPRHGWLCALLGLPVGWDTWPLMACAADARCASRGETVPPLASLNVATLAERFNFFRPVVVVDVAAGRLAWRPTLFFSWCASMLLSMFRSLCFRATGVLAVVFLCFVRLGAIPSHWPVSRSVVAAIRAEWSKVQSSWLGHAVGSVLGLLDVAEGAPLAPALRLSRLWCVRSCCAGCLLGSHLWLLVLWLINGCGRGIALIARPLCWPCFGTSHGLTLLMAVSWGCWLLPRVPPCPRFSLCSAWECPPLVCGLFPWPAPRTVALPSWPSTAAHVVAARRLDAWLCPHGPALPHGCSWTGLLSRPGLMVG
ncbi:hypothetical protein V6N12_020291 [Hibiscus sabdariffa]|uniref:Uncharacterized protein n=1 Tax=Hibiscus sabdariffa TaxID=183260 RepID=A0ABR2BUK0_9ROSI